MHITRKYSDGGKVVSKPEAKRRKATPGMLGTGAAARAGTALRGRREQQMRELGLRDGGRVSSKVKLPGRETRQVRPSQLPPPEKGPAPRPIRRRGRY